MLTPPGISRSALCSTRSRALPCIRHIFESCRPTSNVATFDAFADGEGQRGTSALPGTNGTSRTVAEDFTNTNPAARWEFRTLWSGEAALSVESISVTLLP